RGTLAMANPNDSAGNTRAAQLDGYWGVGTAGDDDNAPTPLLTPFLYTFGFTPPHLVTTRNFAQGFPSVFLNTDTFQVYTNEFSDLASSNRFIQAVFIETTNTAFIPTVYFSPGHIAVEWQWEAIAWPSSAVSSNYFFLTDTFGENTNMQVVFSGQAGPNPTYRPRNYNFFYGTPYLLFYNGVPGQPAPDLSDFDTGTYTNQYAAYQAIFSASTVMPTDVATANITNLPGRIEITATDSLNLYRSRITALNSLVLKATNHFVGNEKAIIASPYIDMHLGRTNGSFAVTNLVAPYLNQLSGSCTLYSSRWTNVVNDITNSFHVLFVRGDFGPTTLPTIQTLNVSVTNSTGAPNTLLISDILNVSSNLYLKAERITIMTNQSDPFTPVGQINILNPNNIWAASAPRLQYFTNWGVFKTYNAVYFGGSRNQLPYNNSQVDLPYEAFVNHGSITNEASLIWSKYFENSGTFDVGRGSIILQKGATVILTNGVFDAANGDISITTASLLASNHVLNAGGSITLAATDYLDDGSLGPSGAFGVENKNTWFAGNGINLPVKPARASLLATMVIASAGDNQEVVSTWAGADLGATPAGFENNAAIGRLVLQGDLDSLFYFVGTGSANALYVDTLDLQDFTADNVDALGNFLSLECASNMKVYFGQALANGVDVSEQLSKVNSGRFVWVSNYNTGFFSSKEVVYADGITRRVNSALVSSCEIDSNGNGIPNCKDPSPVGTFSASSLALSVNYTNTPASMALVSWNAFPNTTNALYATSSPGSTNWQLVTNFVYTASSGNRVQIADTIKTNTPRFYRLRVTGP
ncbi:MAG TPA: hypothetical protein VEC99_11310, partial [Clostridia bacterium]|nr:hypothetical protein [Clostridia bacterium]